jgi:hypothetical protein
MQKAIVPAALLTVAFQKENAPVKKQYELKAVKGKASASHLYSLFFGAKHWTIHESIPADNREGEPDYYSSYE